MKSRDFQSASMHRAGRALVAGVAGMCLVALTACGNMPWRHRAGAGPQPVSELIETAPDGGSTSAFPQYWKRNTLVVDLTSAASSGGQLTLETRDGRKWPKRIAFRVMPGSIGLLEVQADQRLLMPIAREGTKPVDLELVPGVYTPKTPQILLKWEAPKPPPEG